MIELQIENGRLQLHQLSKKDRFEDTGATRVANFDIQNYKLSISSWKWDIVRIGGPGVILVNSSNNREFEVTIKEWRE